MAEKRAVWEKLKLWEKVPQQKRVKVLLLVGLVAIIGIVLSESFSGDKDKTEPEQTKQSVDLEAYADKVENRLQQILACVDGVGKCEVMVTVDSSQESVYSSESESQSQSGENAASASQKNTYVIVDDDGEKPILEKEIEPKIRGVIVVCEGADQVEVREAVIECVRAGLGITSANISVVKGGKHG
ncbi:MAG: hypothetical protein IJJ41_00090 [Clostridia bacterium]|nr:hypothetical protein [Clostridia bacterium]